MFFHISWRRELFCVDHLFIMSPIVSYLPYVVFVCSTAVMETFLHTVFCAFFAYWPAPYTKKPTYVYNLHISRQDDDATVNIKLSICFAAKVLFWCCILSINPRKVWTQKIRQTQLASFKVSVYHELNFISQSEYKTYKIWYICESLHSPLCRFCF
jgi:hypothetical protein